MLPRLAPPPHPPRHPLSGASRNPASGAIETTGLLVALVTAGAVFGLGMLVLPPIAPDEAPVPAPVPPPPAPAAPTPSPAPPPAAPDEPPEAGTSPADAAAAPTAPKAAAVSEPAPAPKPATAAPAKAPETAPAPKPALAAPVTPPAAAKSDAAPSGEAPVAHGKLADKDLKDLAREAWRKNLPDISAEAGKASMLIPIRGSIEGAVFHVTTKPRSVLITLPKAESMITMEFYGPKRNGFRQLWIKKEDVGTTMRVVLGDATDPQVEIKEEFVRVTVRRPTEASGAAPSGGAPTGTGGAPAPEAPTPAATDAPAKPTTPAPRD
jgi:hypothetical protein